MEKKRNTILLVEDDPTHASLIKKELQEFDDSIVIDPVSRAQECFDRFAAGNVYNLIIINYDLPEINGIEALPIIRDKYKFNKPIIMLISYRYEELGIKALNQGATKCVIKTEDYFKRLPGVVRDCLRQGPMEQEKVILEYRPVDTLVQFYMDDQKVVGQKGETILDVASRYGIYIPTLCYHPSVTALGACRICLVEVTQGKTTKLHPSCMFPITKDIVVRTATDRVIKARRMILELLIAKCPETDKLKEMAQEMGVEDIHFKLRDPEDKCTLCGLCVRVCEEVMGASAIGYLGRGHKRKVGPPFMELTDACTGCGECAKICPTGAITLEYIDEKIRKSRATMAVKCDSCAGYSNRACIINCPTGALKVMTIEDYLAKHKGSVNIELKELLRQSLEEEVEQKK
ncbi:MAG: 2Fe-2S iron-sulfur cluster-binding protein [bacterium]